MSAAVRNSLGRFATKRKPPPPLEHRAPDCSICGKEVDHDGDSFRCYDCGAAWDPTGYEMKGEWDEPDEVACPAAIEWFNTDRLGAEHESIRHVVDECYLPDDGHLDHKSTDIWQTWRDDDPRVIRKAGQ